MDQRSSARNRIESLLDAHSFVEIGALVRSRSTDFVQEGKKGSHGWRYLRLWQYIRKAGVCLCPGRKYSFGFFGRNAR